MIPVAGRRDMKLALMNWYSRKTIECTTQIFGEDELVFSENAPATAVVPSSSPYGVPWSHTTF